MAGKKKSSSAEAGSRRKRLKDLEQRLKKLDMELSSIEEDLSKPLHSEVLGEELHRRELISMNVKEDELKRKQMLKGFYKKFVFRCLKCREDFKGEITVEPVIKSLRCPSCGKVHGIGLTPSSRYHNLSIPKSLELVKHE
ncbi:MAG: hypothetical protein V1921_02855 [Candidatus Altiarchaeota archaeon]